MILEEAIQSNAGAIYSVGDRPSYSCCENNNVHRRVGGDYSIFSQGVARVHGTGRDGLEALTSDPFRENVTGWSRHTLRISRDTPYGTASLTLNLFCGSALSPIWRGRSSRACRTPNQDRLMLQDQGRYNLRRARHYDSRAMDSTAARRGHSHGAE